MINSVGTVIDLRIRRTQKLLWEALMALLAEQELESISVKDICDRAMVHRTTFYKHFEDKYDLLLKGMREIYEGLAAEADLPAEAFSSADAPPVFVGFFEHVEKHQGFYRLMLCGDGVGRVQGLLRGYLVELCETRLQKVAQTLQAPGVPVPLLARFCAETVLSSASWWLEGDLAYSSEKMACYVQRLLKSGCVLREESTFL